MTAFALDRASLPGHGLSYAVGVSALPLPIVATDQQGGRLGPPAVGGQGEGAALHLHEFSVCFVRLRNELPDLGHAQCPCGFLDQRVEIGVVFVVSPLITDIAGRGRHARRHRQCFVEQLDLADIFAEMGLPRLYRI